MKTPDIGRRDFIKTVSLGSAGISIPSLLFADERSRSQETTSSSSGSPGPWPVLRHYEGEHLRRISMPIGGIGTGTVSLGGRGDLRDWEIMNRPSKDFVPKSQAAPFVALYLKQPSGKKFVRALEGPLDPVDYEGSHGSTIPNHGLPRFQSATFATAYPLAQVLLRDGDCPVDARLEAFNPLIPADPDSSGLPVAVLRYALHNKGDEAIAAAVCASLPNFIGNDGWENRRDWRGNYLPIGEKENRNHYRKGAGLDGIYMDSTGVDSKSAAWGTMALVTTSTEGVSYRTSWKEKRWGGGLLDFWDDFSADGVPEERDREGDAPMASLAVEVDLPPRTTKIVTFLITWHFPNRRSWTPAKPETDEDIIGNYYTQQYSDAWEAAEKIAPNLKKLESDTLRFVRSFGDSDLPDVVKEAALFNLSTLRSQTCFRTPDGLFYGFEGCSDKTGCCRGSCTHVWNYEQATAFLFGSLACTMREVEFKHATNDQGLMSFRVNLPIQRAQAFGKTAADGQMGCIMKMYRDWQLSGDDALLRSLWPGVRRAIEFCWIKGGWDADKDGVMEGCQHNTMDVEYYGPNPQMGFWYLGALLAGEKMARQVGDKDFADDCHRLFKNGSQWMDTHLFNGEYYEHHIQLPKDESEIAPSLRIGMGAADPTKPDFQLGPGCLVDQLVGQFVAHVCGLGYLAKPENIGRTLQSIRKHNYRADLTDHFNNMRSYVLGKEKALLMASFPKERPTFPFPYFPEAMTGFEYTAAIGMLQEGQIEDGLECIRNIRDRYDGLKRNPFDEAECGHHYARAMASWAAVLILTGFQYSAVEGRIEFVAESGQYFWSTGYAWGTCQISSLARSMSIELEVQFGHLKIKEFRLKSFGSHRWNRLQELETGDELQFNVTKA